MYVSLNIPKSILDGLNVVACPSKYQVFPTDLNHPPATPTVSGTAALLLSRDATITSGFDFTSVRPETTASKWERFPDGPSRMSECVSLPAGGKKQTYLFNC